MAMLLFGSGEPSFTCRQCVASGPRSNVYKASNSQQATLFYSKLKSPTTLNGSIELRAKLTGPAARVGAGVQRELSSKKLLQGVHIGAIYRKYHGDRCVSCFRKLLGNRKKFEGLRNEVNIILRHKNIGVPPLEDDGFLGEDDEGEIECDDISTASHSAEEKCHELKLDEDTDDSEYEDDNDVACENAQCEHCLECRSSDAHAAEDTDSGSDSDETETRGERQAEEDDFEVPPYLDAFI